MKLKVLKILSIVFVILTFCGAAYVLINNGEKSAGYAAVPMLWGGVIIAEYRREKEKVDKSK